MSGRIYLACVLIAAADKRFLGPAAVRSAAPTVSRDGFCSIAVLQNPLDAVPTFDHTPTVVQDGHKMGVAVIRLGDTHRAAFFPDRTGARSLAFSQAAVPAIG
jgi:hypothetical protein